MGRPPLNHVATTIRLPRDLMERLDELVGQNQRAMFIRQAIEARVLYLESLKDRR